MNKLAFPFRIIKSISYRLRKYCPNIIYINLLGVWKILDINSFEVRNKSTNKLIRDALNNDIVKPKGLIIFIYTDDYAPLNNSFPYILSFLSIRFFAYATSSDQVNIELIPDFLFDKWPAAKITSYNQTREELILKSTSPPIFNTCFWAGNTSTHIARQLFYSKFSANKRFTVYDSTKPDSPFISIAEHCNYKYLIDIEGRGYSSRIKLLLLTGRPLFIQERVLNEYYHSMLIPYRHYIPVKSDFSDLIDLLDWADNNTEIVDCIGYNAKEFAMSNLSYDASLQYLRRLLING